MIYTPLTKKALVISFEAHKNQTDKSGMPYVYHPFHLAEQMDEEYAVCVALLHDVVEDTELTTDDLRAEGFPEEVVRAVARMTHPDGVPYLEYVETLKDDPLIETDTIGLKGSPTNVFKAFTPPLKGAGAMLNGDDAAAKLASILAEKHLI